MLEITAIRAIPLRAPRAVPIWSATHVGLDPRLGKQTAASVVLVEVETADGLVGLGQCISGGRNLAALASLIEDVPLVSPDWQPYLFAATVYYCKGTKDPDAPFTKNAREALGGSAA